MFHFSANALRFTFYVLRFTFYVLRFTFYVLRFRSGRTMRIGIDAHMVGARETGNETYCLGLVEGLSQLNDGNDYTVYTASPEIMPELDEHPRFRRRVLNRDSSAWRLTMGFAQASRADRLDLL